MALTGKYRARERTWVMRLLATLTPDQRRRYEAECARAPRHHSTARLYDAERAAIAERIKLEDARAANPSTPPRTA